MAAFVLHELVCSVSFYHTLRGSSIIRSKVRDKFSDIQDNVSSITAFDNFHMQK